MCHGPMMEPQDSNVKTKDDSKSCCLWPCPKRVTTAATRLRRILQAERAEYVARRGDDHGFIARMAEPDGAKPALANQAYLGKLLCRKQTAVGVVSWNLPCSGLTCAPVTSLIPMRRNDPSIHRTIETGPARLPGA